MKGLDEVRRRVQQATLGRRGHKGDPLYEICRVLRRRADRLSEHASARLDAALAAGDPNGEVAVAWWAAQQRCLAYAMTDLAAGRTHADGLIDTFLDCPCPRSPGWAALSPYGDASTWPTSTRTAAATDPMRP
jgi:transposase